MNWDVGNTRLVVVFLGIETEFIISRSSKLWTQGLPAAVPENWEVIKLETKIVVWSQSPQALLNTA